MPSSKKKNQRSAKKRSVSKKDSSKHSGVKKRSGSKKVTFKEEKKAKATKSVPSIVTVKVPRRKPTIETHLQKYEDLLERLDGEIDKRSRTRENGVKFLQSVRKTIRELNREAPKISKFKPKNQQNSKRGGGGLSLKYEISDELADFLKIDRGTPLSRNEITGGLCVYIHLKPDETREQTLRWKHLNPKGKRDLQNPDDRTKIVPDAKLGKLLRYDRYQRDVEKGKITRNKKNKETGEKEEITENDDSLKYFVLQSLITRHILDRVEADKPEDKEEEEEEDDEED